MVMGKVLDELRPDLIHVHDVFMMGVAVRSAQRAKAEGRSVKLVYDSREFIPGLASLDPMIVAAYADLEREFIHDFDRVISVSLPMAQAVQNEYALPVLPDIVANAPQIDHEAHVPALREVVGLDAGIPLITYIGGVNPSRGVDTVVDALPSLPGVHFALVTRPLTGRQVKALEARAERLGVGDRMHVASFVEHDQVTRYVASADIGLSPIQRVPNHDVTITNKFWEYLRAGIPIVSSDTPAEADLVAGMDVGAVHTAGDPDDFARAVTEVLGRLEELKQRITGDPDLQHLASWEAQADVLKTVYEETLNSIDGTARASDAKTAVTAGRGPGSRFRDRVTP
jgi:glycosyltransferase involved in cell wall biosynthesis